MRGKLLAKGRLGRTDKQLKAVARAWAPLGVKVKPIDFGEPKPALYLFYKLLMVCLLKIPSNISCLKLFLWTQNSLWGKMSQINRSRRKKIVTTPEQAGGLPAISRWLSEATRRLTGLKESVPE